MPMPMVDKKSDRVRDINYNTSRNNFVKNEGHYGSFFRKILVTLDVTFV